MSREEVAERSGVDARRVGLLVDLGILHLAGDGFSEGDVRRVRVVQALERGGLPLEAMAKAIASGDLSLDFFDLPVYGLISRMSPVTFEELSEERSIPLDLLLVVREAMGFAQPRAEDLVREDELRVVPVIEGQLAKGVKPSVVEGWLRVYGENLRGIAETEAEWWRTDIQMPALASGLTEVEMLELTNRWGDEMATSLEQALLAVYHAQQEHAWTESFVETVERVLDRSGLRDAIVRPPAMCFIDISGYTALTEERGDAAAAELSARLARLVQQVCEANDGKVVKRLGDGVMLHFRDPGHAVIAALRTIDDVGLQGLPPAHAGIHTGPVLFQGGDYFGRTVNLAARIADRAGPGEVLVSDDVVEAVDLPEVEFEAIGSVELKGVAEPMPLHIARRR